VVERGRGLRGSRCGFSLVELLVAATLIVVALTGIAGSMLSSMALNRVNRETALAQQAACRALEELRSVPFEEAFFVYNTTPGDNPGGTVPERGPNFAVPGLAALASDADGLVGQIEFPVVDPFGSDQLREDVEDEGLGMPRDLNGDLAIDGLDHSEDRLLLPVRVRLEWRGVSGAREIEMETMLCAR
jgi:prepilin-type N-terminal cleavage/methylation domain-containing protein